MGFALKTGSGRDRQQRRGADGGEHLRGAPGAERPRTELERAGDALAEGGDERHPGGGAPRRVAPGERCHDPFVELVGTLAGEYLQRLALGARPSVRTARGDRIECVRHRDDARADRDLLADETAGIAAAIEPL